MPLLKVNNHLIIWIYSSNNFIKMINVEYFWPPLSPSTFEGHFIFYIFSNFPPLPCPRGLWTLKNCFFVEKLGHHPCPFFKIWEIQKMQTCITMKSLIKPYLIEFFLRKSDNIQDKSIHYLIWRKLGISRVLHQKNWILII